MTRDWVIPFAVGIGIGVAAIALGSAFDWSQGAIGTVGVVGMMLGAVLRAEMREHPRDR